MLAEGLRNSCREYDCAARMGGDEFVVILAGSTREAIDAKSLQYQQITRQVGMALCQEDILSVSIGEAYFPEDGTDAEQLLAVADKRMYEVKHRQGGSRLRAGGLLDRSPVLIQ
jgi:diguanylate cyclase (GGDEF)-like protein